MTVWRWRITLGWPNERRMRHVMVFCFGWGLWWHDWLLLAASGTAFLFRFLVEHNRRREPPEARPYHGAEVGRRY